jgi:Flp pilus assembly protein TadB
MLGLLVPAAAAILALAGVRLSLLLWASLTIALAVAGFLGPDLSLRRHAAARRREFREATSIWLDLVAVSLAGGAGIEEAMTTTSASGQGWAFVRLRDALDRSRLAGEPPWATLGRLGDDLDLVELRELSASLALAGTEGARVRRSLTAKAASLRQHEVADAETAAAAVTERLVLPVGLLLLGFVLFLGFPALLRVFSSV